MRNVSVAGLVIAAADYAWQRHRVMSQLKMTRQEVREEMKQQEGNPETKRAIRSRQAAMSRNRMIGLVGGADVVIVNPTHFAVALRYVAPDGSKARYPDAPNGSVDDIAGICDPTGRVLGLMPHPERNITPWHHPRWTRMGPREAGEGLDFYRRMVEFASTAAS